MKAYFPIIAISVLVVVGCQAEIPGQMSISVPKAITQIRAYSPSNLFVKVSVNDANAQQFEYTGEWSIPIIGIVRDSNNSVDVAWYERFEGRSLLLARQSEDFYIGLATTQINMTATFTSEGDEFDCDADGVSNLQERRAGTAPCINDIDSNVVVNIVEPDMVSVTGGCFDMGSPDTELDRDADEGPQISVCVKDFLIGQFEVTYAQYDAFTQATSRAPQDDGGWGRGNQPVILIDWVQATAYAAWLATETGLAYRLPTEAEWEYVARAGTTTEFSTGSFIQPAAANFDSRFVYNGSSANILPADRPLEIGRYPANPFGVYDMHGNVWEWTCSEYRFFYSGEEQQCSNSQSGLRVARGGSWFNPPKFVRSANRSAKEIGFNNSITGFRMARDQ